MFEELKKSETMNNNSNVTKAVVKRRKNRRDYEIFKPANSKIFPIYSDRFIPLRSTAPRTERNLFYYNNQDLRDIFQVSCEKSLTTQQDMVAIALQHTFNIEKRRIFNFTNDTPGSPLTGGDFRRLLQKNQDWTCKILSKRRIYREEEHEIVEDCLMTDSNSTDWSVNNDFVMIGENCVKLWSRSQKYTMTMKVEGAKALAYSPQGDLLIVGCAMFGLPILELWSFGKDDLRKDASITVAEREFIKTKYQSVTCLEWLKNGKQVACGTQEGSVLVFAIPQLKVIRRLSEHNVPVKLIRYSADMVYMATGDIKGTIVIYKMPSYSTYLYVKSGRAQDVSFDWHPWNCKDLAVSERKPASIIILHMPSKKVAAFYQSKSHRNVIEAITFNKITAELVVSLSEIGPDFHRKHRVLVLASLQSLVTEIGGSGNNRFVRWSADGTQLMTTSDDEIIRMWSFHPHLPLKKPLVKPPDPKSKLIFETLYASRFRKLSTLR